MRTIGRFVRFVFCVALLVLALLPTIWYLYPTAPPFESFYHWRINNYLNVMTPEVKNSIASITIVEDLGKSEKGKTIAGLCDPERNIFFIPYAIITQPSIIYHEAAHALHNRLYKNNSKFCPRWEFITGGVLTSYGLTSYWEDVADWVCETYKDLDGEWTKLDGICGQANMNPYRQKLLLLREYKFISENDYQKIIEMHPELSDE